MYLKKYTNINKYFAFVFMVFAVLSGVAENHGEVSAVSAKASGLPYFLRMNQLLLTQNIIKIRVQQLLNKYNPFIDYLQSLMAERDASDIYKAGLIFGSLFVVACNFNGILEQNNIWRNAVF